MKREPLVFFAFGIVFGFPLGYMIHTLGEGGVAAPPPSVQAASLEGAPSTAGTPAPQPLDPNEVKSLESLAGREKGNARVRAELGNLFMDHGSFDDAVRWYQQSLDLEPKNDDVRVDMGVSLLNAGRSVEALTAFDTALKNTPGHKKALFNKGVALMSSGRPKEAVALWEDLIKRYPDDPQLRGLKQQIEQVRTTLPREVLLVIGFLSRLIRVLGLLLLVRLVLRALSGGSRTTRRASKPEAPGELVHDVVCNTHLLKSRAVRASIGGRECYFCSDACREKAVQLAQAS